MNHCKLVKFKSEISHKHITYTIFLLSLEFSNFIAGVPLNTVQQLQCTTIFFFLYLVFKKLQCERLADKAMNFLI